MLGDVRGILVLSGPRSVTSCDSLPRLEIHRARPLADPWRQHDLSPQVLINMLGLLGLPPFDDKLVDILIESQLLLAVSHRKLRRRVLVLEKSFILYRGIRYFLGRLGFTGVRYPIHLYAFRLRGGFLPFFVLGRRLVCC
jgi:hypothetical protein